MKKFVVDSLKIVISFTLAGVFSLAFVAFCVNAPYYFQVRQEEKEARIEKAEIDKEKELAGKLALSKFSAGNFETLENIDENVPHTYTVTLSNDLDAKDMKARKGSTGEGDSFIFTHKVSEKYVVVPEYGENGEIKRATAKPIKKIFVDLQSNKIQETE